MFAATGFSVGSAASGPPLGSPHGFTHGFSTARDGGDVRVVDDLIGFIDASPTPWHAVSNAVARLSDAGFERFDPANAGGPGARMVERDGALLAWVDSADVGSPLRMIGAHTDSPGLRIRPRPDRESAGFRQLAVEIYGGVLLNSWLDRDLGLAGRVVLDDGTDTTTVLYRSSLPLLRVPQLAIHLDREIGEVGLRLDRQEHMTPVWGLSDGSPTGLVSFLAEELDRAEDEILGWDLMCFDTQPAARLGVDHELLAAARLDDLCCVFGAVESLIARRWSSDGPAAAILLVDHEEVGSSTHVGAASSWVAQILEQRAAALGLERSEHLSVMANSILLSADMAHATHPNYSGRHEPGHWIRAGGGLVIKHNVNARYATDAVGAAELRRICRDAGVPLQDYSHRNDLPCGSTIGPIAAAGLGVRTIDVGVPQLSMHSARELMAVDDVPTMTEGFTAWMRAPL